MLTSTDITYRFLPPEEWDRLRAMPFGSRGLPPPEHCIILVAETAEGEIVGLWSCMTAFHMEGLWVADAYRKHTFVAATLLSTMRANLVEQGILNCFTIVESDYVLELAKKAGFEVMPGVLCHWDLTPKEEG
jgi:hypothetical protein